MQSDSENSEPGPLGGLLGKCCLISSNTRKITLITANIDYEHYLYHNCLKVSSNINSIEKSVGPYWSLNRNRRN